MASTLRWEESHAHVGMEVLVAIFGDNLPVFPLAITVYNSPAGKRHPLPARTPSSVVQSAPPLRVPHLSICVRLRCR